VETVTCSYVKTRIEYMPSKPGYNKAHTMSTAAENHKVTIEYRNKESQSKS